MDNTFEVGTIDFRVYEDANNYLGMASVKLPDRNQKVITLNGAGIGGDVEVPVNGNYDAMTMDMVFQNYSQKVATLREHRRHNIELRTADQVEDKLKGEIVTVPVKHVMIVVPKSASGGEIKTASQANTTVTVSVRYWATYINGEKVDELDPLNRIDIINGTDYDAPVRAALGL